VARYTDDSKDRVRDAVDFVALVAARTGDELRRTGPHSYMGLCPFHDERTPSFSVEPVAKLFHCFGCGESGDVFDFAMKTENLDFTGALEYLADRAGVKLERTAEDPQAAERRARRERLLELLERTATYYVRVLWESDEAAGAREYLLGRGLEEATLREFRVGYAPSAWDRVLMTTQRAGFKARELYDAGLVQRSKGDGRVYDRFRGRVMFPLADARGRVLGFGARALRDNQQPKYLNTAENELFHKGQMVYAADLARASAAKAGGVVLCEGYTDVIALHQAGLRNAVATMGTALTGDQVGELAKLAPVVHMALDADSAGQNAMLKAAQVAAGRVQLRVVPLPAGTDPADLVARDGADAMRGLVAKSIPFVRFRVERALATGDRTTAEGKDRVLEELRPVFAGLGPSLLRQELIRLTAEALDVSDDEASSMLGSAPRHPRIGAGPREAPAPTSFATRIDRREQTELEFLGLCIDLPTRGRGALAEVDDDDFTAPRTRRAAMWLREHLEAPLEGLPRDDEELTALVGQLVMRAPRRSPSPAALEAEMLSVKIARLDRRIEARDGSVPELAALRNELKVRRNMAAERAMDASLSVRDTN
jgi:DNA primase